MEELIKRLQDFAAGTARDKDAQLAFEAADTIEELSKRVPKKPHGDLIERDAIMDDIIGSIVFSGRNVPKEAAIVQKVLDIIGDANAIIPAEEGE